MLIKLTLKLRLIKHERCVKNQACKLLTVVQHLHCWIANHSFDFFSLAQIIQHCSSYTDLEFRKTYHTLKYLTSLGKIISSNLSAHLVYLSRIILFSIEDASVPSIEGASLS